MIECVGPKGPEGTGWADYDQELTTSKSQKKTAKVQKWFAAVPAAAFRGSGGPVEGKEYKLCETCVRAIETVKSSGLQTRLISFHRHGSIDC